MTGLLLRLETALALGVAWMLVFLSPLRLTRRLLGVMERPAARPTAPNPVALARARGVARRIAWMARRLPWHSTCLVQAVAGLLLLARRGIGGGMIRFGVRKAGPALEAHAWLMLGETVLLGGETAEEYVPLADLTSRAAS